MPGSKEFDPMAYIESAFLDKSPNGVTVPVTNADAETAVVAGKAPRGSATKFRKTALSAPRPRRVKSADSREPLDDGFKELLEHLPRNIEFLGKFFNDSVTSHYYNHGFKESREDLIKRLLDPELTLEEVSRLLGVCPATVRRYTNRGWIDHHRTKGGQRRFRLSSVVRFVDRHGRTPEA
ncbi:MAG: helix-turn-helix domain-containing protein [Armatimonadetes bacterium]|nr:helix-turn-helix domain-containing protein [Armatimonadota bacterium]